MSYSFFIVELWPLPFLGDLKLFKGNCLYCCLLQCSYLPCTGGPRTGCSTSGVAWLMLSKWDRGLPLLTDCKYWAYCSQEHLLFHGHFADAYSDWCPPRPVSPFLQSCFPAVAWSPVVFFLSCRTLHFFPKLSLISFLWSGKKSWRAVNTLYCQLVYEYT